jgi:hypothetical protein
MLCQTVLDPARLTRLAVMTGLHTRDGFSEAFSDAVLDGLKKDLYAGAALPEWLLHLEELAKEDLKRSCDAAFVRPDEPDPLYLPNLARWAALPIQAEIILEELPVLAAAIRVDVEEGTGRPTRGTRFLAEADAEGGILNRIAGAVDPSKSRPSDRLELGCEALAGFDSAGIGREPLWEEVGSNSLIRTASKATGVLATVLDSDAEKVRALKPVTRAVRGALLLPYWMVNGLAGGGTIARFLATVGLVVGGVLVALSLLGVLGGAAAAAGTVGAAALLAVLAYSAARTGSLLHAAALLAPVGPLAAYAWSAGDAAKEAASRVLVVLLAAAALYLLASLPWPLSSPLRLLQRWLDRLGWETVGSGWRVVKLIVLIALAVGAVYAGLDVWSLLQDLWGSPQVTNAVDWLRSGGWATYPPWVLGLIMAAVVIGGAVIAYRQGALLRIWRPAATPPVTYPEGKHVEGKFSREAVRHPAGVAASWAPVYGTLYLAAAALLFHLTIPPPEAPQEQAPLPVRLDSMLFSLQVGEQPVAGDQPLPVRADWVLFSLCWLVALGVLLCLVAPVVTARPPRRQTRTMLRAAWKHLAVETANSGSTDTRLPRENNVDQRLLYALMKYGVAFDYLISAKEKDKSGELGQLGLSRIRGKQLLRHVRKKDGSGSKSLLDFAKEMKARVVSLVRGS